MSGQGGDENDDVTTAQPPVVDTLPDRAFDSDTAKVTVPRAAVEPDDAFLDLDTDPVPLKAKPRERYKVGESIGRGGSGEVLEAQDRLIGREVAIKRLRTSQPTKPQLTRFLREARIQGRLDHPAIVPVHDLQHDSEGRPFIVMKKLSGITLGEILRSPGAREKFPRARLLRAFADVCLAIELAHTRGVVHRDVKPANVLLGDFGEVYVLDWGIARVVGEPEDRGIPGSPVVTAVGTLLGTPGYMSPEQARCDADLDGRADVFALGCLLFEILTGTPLHPPGIEGLKTLIDGFDARASLRGGDRTIPPELDELCVRATDLDRSKRMSARELGEAVQNYLDGDRDIALRKTLAREHLAVARAAIGGKDTEKARRVAMRESGKALALDPKLAGAAELVGHLMLEPPREMPREVVLELNRADVAAGQRQARIGIGIHLGYFLLVPLFLIFGVHDAPYLIALAGIAGLNLALGVLEIRRRTSSFAIVIIAGNIIITMLFARMFTPFLVAPGVGAVTLMALAFHPATSRPRALAIAGISAGVAILGVFALERLGVIAATTTVDGRTIYMSSTLDFTRFPIEPAMCFYVVALLLIAGLLASNVATAERAMRRHLYLQAWQLRQLVSPETTPSPR